jgi:hypothetical protein
LDEAVLFEIGASVSKSDSNRRNRAPDFNDNPRMNPEWLGYAAAILTTSSFIPQP